MATVSVLWPVNIPMAGLALKIRQGHTPIDMEDDEYWWRCTGGSLVLAVATLVCIWVDHLLTGNLDLPAGPVHMVIFFAFIAAGGWLYELFFALEDFFAGLGMVMIYLYIPMTVLFLLNLVTGWWNPLLRFALGWLK